MRNEIIFVALLVCLLAGCKKEVAAYTPPDGSYGLIYTKVFATTCASSGCHNGAQAAPSPILKGEGAYDALLGVTPHNAQAATADLKLIVPNDPDKSFLYQKIIFDSSAYRFGAAMPAGGLTLGHDPIAFLRQWIVAGAPHDGHVADQNLIH